MTGHAFPCFTFLLWFTRQPFSVHVFVVFASQVVFCIICVFILTRSTCQYYVLVGILANPPRFCFLSVCCWFLNSNMRMHVLVGVLVYLPVFFTNLDISLRHL